MTDFEGNFDYFMKLAAASVAFQVVETATGRLKLADGWRFVYGGDVTDHVMGDLRTLDALLKLRDRYGSDRVTLVMGNRDVNKMRLKFELAPQRLCPRQRPAHLVEGAYWKPPKERLGLVDFLRQL